MPGSPPTPGDPGGMGCQGERGSLAPGTQPSFSLGSPLPWSAGHYILKAQQHGPRMPGSSQIESLNRLDGNSAWASGGCRHPPPTAPGLLVSPAHLG